MFFARVNFSFSNLIGCVFLETRNEFYLSHTQILCCRRLNCKLFCFRTCAYSVCFSFLLRFVFGFFLFLGLMLETITKWICLKFWEITQHIIDVKMWVAEEKWKWGPLLMDEWIYWFMAFPNTYACTHAGTHTYVRVDSFILAVLLLSLGLLVSASVSSHNRLKADWSIQISVVITQLMSSKMRHLFCPFF